MDFGDFGFWGFWILDSGEFGFWILDFESQIQNPKSPKSKIPKIRPKKLGVWSLGILDFWDFGDFAFWILGILDFGFSGFWGFWILDFWNIM